MRKLVIYGLLALLLVFGICLLQHFHFHFDPRALKIWLDQFGVLTPVIFLIIYILGTIFFIPGMPLSLLGGLLFGPVWGFVFNLFAATVGASLAFLIARHTGGRWLSKKTAPLMNKMIHGASKDGWRYVALLRLTPLAPFTILNYAFGLTPIRLNHFIISSIIFMAPGCWAYTYLGSLGLNGTSLQATSIKHIFLAIGVIAFMLLIGQLLKNRRDYLHNISEP